MVELLVVRARGLTGFVTVEYRTDDDTALSVGKVPPDYVVSTTQKQSPIAGLRRVHFAVLGAYDSLFEVLQNMPSAVQISQLSLKD